MSGAWPILSKVGPRKKAGPQDALDNVLQDHPSIHLGSNESEMFQEGLLIAKLMNILLLSLMLVASHVSFVLFGYFASINLNH